MQFRPFVLAAIASLAEVSSAAPQAFSRGGYVPNQQSSSASASTRCYTNLASTAAFGGRGWAGATSWSTKYTPCTTIETITVSTTSTPSPVTSTITDLTTVTTTEETLTETSSTTTTNTETSTTTTVVTTTDTSSTTVTTTTTTTAAAGPGFTPIQTSLPGSTYEAPAAAAPVSKREELSRRQRQGTSYPNSSPNDKWSFSNVNNVQGVNCFAYKPSPQCTTSTLAVTVTITASTPTSTTTVTDTISSTVVPSATTTTTITTITTATETATETTGTVTTTTITSTATSTVYAACETNNFANRYNGQGFGNAFASDGTPWSGVRQTTATSPYDCCVAALTDPNAGSTEFWAWTSNNSCQIPYTNTCPATPGSNTSRASLSSSFTYTFGNGYCGVVNSV